MPVVQVTAPDPTSGLVLSVIRSPAVVIAACAVAVRWVLAPAVTNYMRHELRAELSQLAQFPRYVERIERIEAAVEKLSVVPEALARIEEQVESLHNDMHAERRAGQDRRQRDLRDSHREG